jgi:hypothetical protein
MEKRRMHPGQCARTFYAGRRSSPTFEMRVVPLAPGGVLAYDEPQWRDAVVVVECGEVELESTSGARRRLEQGAILWLVGLPVRALHNPGTEPALLVALSRRRMAVGS